MEKVVDWISENLWLLSGGLITGIIILFLIKIIRLRIGVVAAKAGCAIDNKDLNEGTILRDPKYETAKPCENRMNVDSCPDEEPTAMDCELHDKKYLPEIRDCQIINPANKTRKYIILRVWKKSILEKSLTESALYCATR